MLICTAAPAAAEGCGGLDRQRPVVRTELVTPEPDVHNSIPYATVRRMVGASRAVLLGVTQFRKEPLYEFRTTSRPAPDGDGYCATLTEVVLRIRYHELSISIASEVEPGTCTYDVTMEHERAHVAYEHGAVRKALHEMGKEAGRARRPFHGDDEAEAVARAEAQVARWAKTAHERADKVARRGHNYMDIQSNIKGSLARCPDWPYKRNG
jgi:hypothetical protein